MSSRSWVLVFAGFAVALAAGCQRPQERSTVVAGGYVDATEVRVSTKVGGTISRFELDDGDGLARGDVVAEMDTVDLELSRAAAVAERDRAAARVDVLREGFRTEDIAAARATVERAAVELSAAERDLERFETLLARGSGTDKARDDARARRDMAAKSLEAARENLAKLEAGYRPVEIREAEAAVAAAAARVAQVTQQIADAVVRSPVDGVATETLVEQGEVVPAGTVLAMVTDLSDVWLVVYVSEPDLGHLRLGQEAEVVTDDGQQRTGTLSYISPRAEFTPKNVQTADERAKLVYEVHVRLPNDDLLFKPGMPATARLPVQ